MRLEKNTVRGSEKKETPERHFLSQLRHMVKELWARLVFVCGKGAVRVGERRRGREEKETHASASSPL